MGLSQDRSIFEAGLRMNKDLNLKVKWILKLRYVQLKVKWHSIKIKSAILYAQKPTIDTELQQCRKLRFKQNNCNNNGDIETTVQLHQ